MLLKQMEYFCAVVERGSFTKAATTCFVSQSAISQQLKQLEADLGCTLLERTGRSFSLTPAGESFYRNARDVLNRTRAACREARRLGSGEPDRLVVGYSRRYDGPELSRAIAAFTERHPATEVSAVAGSHGALYDALLEGRIDLKVNDRRRQLSDDFVNEPLFSAHTWLEVPARSPFAPQPHVAVPELAGQICILLAEEERREAERSYYQDVLNFPCDFIFAQSLEEARLLVAANRGLLLVDTRPAPEGQDAPADPLTTQAPLVRVLLVSNGAPLRSDYFAFWPKTRTTQANREFAELLKRQA